MIDRQAIFNAAYKGLLAQGVKSGRIINITYGGKEEFMCLYRGPNGTKCAIGQYIDDEMARLNEGRRAHTVFALDEFWKKGTDGNFVNCLQEIHDKNEPDQWPDLLTDFARTWNLEIPQ